jgi:hypothetical protein
VPRGLNERLCSHWTPAGVRRHGITERTIGPGFLAVPASHGLEAGGWRLGAGGLEAGGWGLEAGGVVCVAPAFRPAAHVSSRCTVSGENAGVQTAMYSAPPCSGVLYRTHSPGAVTTA